jgi:hypothetical protein
MIVAGRKSDVYWGAGNWLFLDIGFANNGRTCGVLFNEEKTTCMRYGEARTAIVERIRKQSGSINLLIEAPLSICFDPRKNPKGGTVEREGNISRYWYVGAGCVVMTAAMYLIRDIHEAIKDLPNTEVRLFEGFVSFKQSSTNHETDVIDLREMVRNAAKNQDSIYGPDRLKLAEDDEICSAFRVAGLDFGVPAVIVARNPQSQPSLNSRT